MCLTASQVLIVIGLGFQASSVVYQAIRAYYPFKSEEEKWLQYMKENKWTNVRDQIKKRRKEWFWTLFLFFIGPVFQGIAEFVR